MRYVILILTVTMLFMGYSIQQLETRLDRVQSHTEVSESDVKFQQFLALVERLAVLEHTKQEGKLDK